MFGCNGISDPASWNEVFHYYWDTKLSCPRQRTPKGDSERHYMYCNWVWLFLSESKSKSDPKRLESGLESKAWFRFAHHYSVCNVAFPESSFLTDVTEVKRGPYIGLSIRVKTLNLHFQLTPNEDVTNDVPILTRQNGKISRWTKSNMVRWNLKDLQ